MAPMPGIEKIGFFHFGHGWDKPVPSLQCALEKHASDRIRNTLIVLPEGFNIGAEYRRTAPAPKTDPGILFALQGICFDFKIALVAGLIITTPGSPTPPFSSAYLIDSEGFGLLCHKRQDDGTGQAGGTQIQNYTQCTNGCDTHNAVRYCNISVAALICMDAFTSGTGTAGNRDRHEILEQRLGNDSVRVVCFPSHTKDCSQVGLAEPWRHSFVVVANSSSSRLEPGSFIAEVDGQGGVSIPDDRRACGTLNEVRACGLPPHA